MNTGEQGRTGLFCGHIGRNLGVFGRCSGGFRVCNSVVVRAGVECSLMDPRRHMQVKDSGSQPDSCAKLRYFDGPGSKLDCGNVML